MHAQLPEMGSASSELAQLVRDAWAEGAASPDSLSSLIVARCDSRATCCFYHARGVLAPW